MKFSFPALPWSNELPFLALYDVIKMSQLMTLTVALLLLCFGNLRIVVRSMFLGSITTTNSSDDFLDPTADETSSFGTAGRTPMVLSRYQISKRRPHLIKSRAWARGDALDQQLHSKILIFRRRLLSEKNRAVSKIFFPAFDANRSLMSTPFFHYQNSSLIKNLKHNPSLTDQNSYFPPKSRTNSVVQDPHVIGGGSKNSKWEEATARELSVIGVNGQERNLKLTSAPILARRISGLTTVESPISASGGDKQGPINNVTTLVKVNGSIVSEVPVTREVISRRFSALSAWHFSKRRRVMLLHASKNKQPAVTPAGSVDNENISSASSAPSFISLNKRSRFLSNLAKSHLSAVNMREVLASVPYRYPHHVNSEYLSQTRLRKLRRDNHMGTDYSQQELPVPRASKSKRSTFRHSDSAGVYLNQPSAHTTDVGAEAQNVSGIRDNHVLPKVPSVKPEEANSGQTNSEQTSSGQTFSLARQRARRPLHRQAPRRSRRTKRVRRRWRTGPDDNSNFPGLGDRSIDDDDISSPSKAPQVK